MKELLVPLGKIYKDYMLVKVSRQIVVLVIQTWSKKKEFGNVVLMGETSGFDCSPGDKAKDTNTRHHLHVFNSLRHII